ncbi:hypothetical protein PO124_13845 [Bacillus licheniformis]|nr:hypothetical protein [Bacillus licheniformis]
MYYDGFLQYGSMSMAIARRNWMRPSKTARQIAHSTLLGMTNVPATELAEVLIKITPEI